MIRVECPCGEVARVPSALAGHAGRCARCGGGLVAPGEPLVAVAPLLRSARAGRRPGESGSGEFALDLDERDDEGRAPGRDGGAPEVDSPRAPGAGAPGA